MAQDLISPQDLATATSLPADDPRLLQAAKRASGRFYGDTNRASILTATSTERHNGTGGPALLLRGAPVASVASVTVAGVALVEHTDYQIDTEAGILRRTRGSWPAGLGNVVVEYTHGYDEVPGDIWDAVLEHAATIALVQAHLVQEGGGSTQAAYAKEATIGTTAKWVAAVAKYDLSRRS